MMKNMNRAPEGGDQKDKPTPFDPFVKGDPDAGSLHLVMDKDRARMGEIPSVNGNCSARGLAKIAACMANGGKLGNIRIMSDSGVEAMQDKGLDKMMFGQDMITRFTQGGVNHSKVVSADKPLQRKTKKLRDGYYGW